MRARLRDDELTPAQQDGVFVRGECDPSVKVDEARSDELGSTICMPGGRLVEYPMSWVVHATARPVSAGHVLELHTVVSDVDPPRFLYRGQWSEFYFLPTSAAIGHVATLITETRGGHGHAFECSDLICIVGSNRDAGAFACGEHSCAERPWPSAVPRRVPRAIAPACEEDYLSEHESPSRKLAPDVRVQIVTGKCEDEPYLLEFTRVRVWSSPSPDPTITFWASIRRACKPRWRGQGFVCDGARFEWSDDGFILAPP
jgi:hypothetical protein